MQADLLSHLVITRVDSASTIYNPAGAAARKKDRGRWAIVCKYEGETVYCVGDKHFLSDLQHIMVLPRGCSYDWECTKSGHYASIEFESELSFDEPIRFPTRHGEQILKQFKELERIRSLRKPLFEIESIKIAYDILLRLAQSAHEKYTPSKKQERLLPAIEYLSEHCTEPIKNDTVAALLGMSTVYFRKLFAEVMGTSPMAFARALRIEKAKEMLRTDYGSLSDIAESLGYQSLYDFSRDFKKHTGSAPSKYESK